jgi:hypothetical protein
MIRLAFYWPYGSLICFTSLYLSSHLIFTFYFSLIITKYYSQSLQSLLEFKNCHIILFALFPFTAIWLRCET